MVAYNVDTKKLNAETTVCAKAEALRIHFKNIVNVATAVKHMTLKRAKEYLANVLEMKEAVAMLQHKKGRGRHAQVSLWALPLPPPAPPPPPPRPFPQFSSLGGPSCTPSTHSPRTPPLTRPLLPSRRPRT